MWWRTRAFCWHFYVCENGVAKISSLFLCKDWQESHTHRITITQPSHRQYERRCALKMRTMERERMRAKDVAEARECRDFQGKSANLSLLDKYINSSGNLAFVIRAHIHRMSCVILWMCGFVILSLCRLILARFGVCFRVWCFIGLHSNLRCYFIPIHNFESFI